MLVSSGNLFHHGKVLKAGEPITDVENWRGGILQIHLASGRILDVSPEVAERMRAEQVKRDHRALGQRVEKELARAKHASMALAGKVESLTKELEEAELALSVAEEHEFEVTDKLENLRKEYGDLALGFSPSQESEPEESGEEPPSAEPDHASVAMAADELRSRAIAAVGGFTRFQLAGDEQNSGKFGEWWGLDLYAMKGADGKFLFSRNARKQDVVDAAVAVYEARHRLNEVAKMGGMEPPDEESLRIASLVALGAADKPSSDEPDDE